MAICGSWRAPLVITREDSFHQQCYLYYKITHSLFLQIPDKGVNLPGFKIKSIFSYLVGVIVKAVMRDSWLNSTKKSYQWCTAFCCFQTQLLLNRVPIKITFNCNRVSKMITYFMWLFYNLVCHMCNAILSLKYQFTKVCNCLDYFYVINHTSSYLNRTA